MKILPGSPESIAQAAAHLRAGELVGMPTETVYGLAGDGLNPSALAKIFDTKERPTFDPLILHIADRESLARLVDYSKLSETARINLEILTQAFWPGPLTLVLPKLAIVPDLATSGLDTVAIRMPRHPIARALIQATGVPLAAPSANRFGRISPTRAEHVKQELGARVAYVIDGGPCEIGIESTILKISEDGSLSLLRPGEVSAAQIAEKTGTTPARANATQGAQLAPGMLESHYAPTKRLIPLRSLSELPPEAAEAKTLGLLLLSGDPEKAARKFESLTHKRVLARSLSRDANPSEMARNLFATLRELDHSEAEVLFCEAVPEGEGLLHAIGDRLRRASAAR